MRIADLESRMQTMMPIIASTKLAEMAAEIKQAEFSNKEVVMQLQFEQAAGEVSRKFDLGYQLESSGSRS